MKDLNSNMNAVLSALKNRFYYFKSSVFVVVVFSKLA